MLIRIFTAALLIYSMLVVTACPSRDSLEKAQKESAKVAGYANLGVELTRELYRSNFISLAQKDKIADGFIALAKAGQAFDTAVANAIAQYGETAPPPTELDRLFHTFDDQVVAQLVAVLASLKLTGVSGHFAEIINTIKTAVLLVASRFGRRSTVQVQLAGT
jgi:hypothetical protein